MGDITIEPLDLEAIRTGPCITETAFPGARQESITFGNRTSPNEFGDNRGLCGAFRALFAALAYIADTAEELIALLLNDKELLIHLRLDIAILLHERPVLLCHVASLEFPLGNDLVGRQEALFTIQQHRLAMGEIGLVEEGGRTDGVEEGPGP